MPEGMLTFEIEDNGFVQRLTALSLRAEKIPTSVFDDIGQILIQSQIKSFEAGGRPVPWKPSILNPRTLRSPQDKLMHSGEVSSVSEKHVEVTWGDSLPYRLALFFGVDIQITDKMRKFFLAKYLNTREPMWASMLNKKKTEVHIDPRIYLWIQDEDSTNIAQLLADYVMTGEYEFVRTME